jgi:hypothetical protein
MNSLKPKNDLERVIVDLQNEHTRFQNRLTALKNTAPQDGFNYIAKHNLQVAYLESKLEYLELLIRRYRSWLV